MSHLLESDGYVGIASYSRDWIIPSAYGLKSESAVVALNVQTVVASSEGVGGSIVQDSELRDQMTRWVKIKQNASNTIQSIEIRSVQNVYRLVI